MPHPAVLGFIAIIVLAVVLVGRYHGAKSRRIGARALKTVYSRIIKPFEFDPLSQNRVSVDGDSHRLEIDEATAQMFDLPQRAGLVLPADMRARVKAMCSQVQAESRWYLRKPSSETAIGPALPEGRRRMSMS